MSRSPRVPATSLVVSASLVVTAALGLTASTGASAAVAAPPATAVPLAAPARLAPLTLAATAAASTRRELPLVSTVAAERRVGKAIGHRRVARSLQRFLGKNLAIRVEDAESGRIIFGRQARQGKLPASNMKLVTAFNALSVLGPDHRFATTVVSGATPDAVVLRAGGDPLLTSADLTELAKRTTTALVAKLAEAKQRDPGSTLSLDSTFTLSFDDSLFPAFSNGPGWSRGYVPYVVAPVSALSRDLRTGADPGRSAATYFGTQLTKLAAAAGVTVRFSGGTSPGRTVASTDAASLAALDGHSVEQAVRLMLTVSQNDVAEILYRQVAVGRGLVPTWANSAAAAAATLREHGISTSRLVAADGSGVSRYDRISAITLAALLRQVADPTRTELASMYYGASGFGPSLPVAGKTGTLAARNGRYTTKPSRCAAGIVVAKTGTLHDVVALSGIAPGADGQLKVFSIMVNNRNERYSALSTRRAVDALAATVTGCF